MSTLSTANIESKAANTPPVIKDLNGTECGRFCRAWVNFNGTGTVAIRDSFNVSSITDNGTGQYTVNFTTNFNDISYAAFINTSDWTGDANYGTASPAVSSVGVRTRNGASTFYDYAHVYVAIFR